VHRPHTVLGRRRCRQHLAPAGESGAVCRCNSIAVSRPQSCVAVSKAASFEMPSSPDNNSACDTSRAKSLCGTMAQPPCPTARPSPPLLPDPPQEGHLATLRGVLPGGPTIQGPALVAPFDLAAWLEHQQEQELAGTPPHAHTHPNHGLRLGLRKAAGNGGAARWARHHARL
jgi:hypothetical protein